MQYVEAAKNAIINGEPERAIALLREYLAKIEGEQIKKLTDDLILLGSRYSFLRNDKLRDTITYDVANQEINRINQALIEVIDELENGGEAKGIFQKPLLMNIPRNAVSDTIYNGFIIFGLVAGTSLAVAFFYTLYGCILDKDGSIERLLFIGSLGFFTTAFLSGAYEGINRREGMLINWRVTAPQMALAIGMIVAAAVLTWLKG